MARVNIEECWWSDPRRSKLIKLVGDEERADGLAIKMWRLAQNFWKEERQCVPAHIFQTLDQHNALLECQLAVLDVDGANTVYVRGSSQYLNWVFEEKQKKSAAGKKSAQRARDIKGRLLPRNAQQPSNTTPTQPNTTQLSGSGSGSRSKDLGYKGSSGEAPSLLIELVYQDYPKRKNTRKAKGIARLKADVKSTEDLEQAIRAAKNYHRYCRDKGLEPAYIKQFATWASEWREWVDPEADEAFRPQSSFCGFATEPQVDPNFMQGFAK